MKTPRMFIVGASVLLSTAIVFGEVEVTVDHNSNENATDQFKFKNVPSPAPDTAAAKAKFTIVAGEADGNGADVSALNDGKLPVEEDQPDSNFFFAEDTAGGRVEADLGNVIPVKEINSYSWHPNTRGPQVYRLYASDGTADDFNAKPGTGIDPEKTGWKLIAIVDTRPKSGDGGGQYGVNISDSTGLIGKFRYLLFDMSRTEADDSFGNTFYSEINVIAADGSSAGEKAASPEENAAAVQVPLAPYFNKIGIQPDGAEFEESLDDGGWSCSSNLLGTAQVWNGVKFNLGSASASNVVTCAGQTIPLPSGHCSSLRMLALAVNGDQESQNFTVTYADSAAPLPVTQSFSDWFTPEDYSGESRVVTMPYRNQSDGTKDEQTFYLYGYSFSLNPTNSVKDLKLPDNANVKIFAITLVP
jgi:hypothetical protein